MEEHTKGADIGSSTSDVLTLIGAGGILWREMKGIAKDAVGLESVFNDRTHQTSTASALDQSGKEGDSEDEIENTTVPLHESTLGFFRPAVDYRRGRFSHGPAAGDESSASSIATTGGGSRYDQLSAYLHINQVKHSFYGSPEREDSPSQSPPLSPLPSEAEFLSESQQSPARARKAGADTADEAGTEETELDSVRATENDLGIPTSRRLFGTAGEAGPVAPAVQDSHHRPGSPVLGGAVTEVVHATWTQCSSTQTSPSRTRSPAPEDEYFSAGDDAHTEGLVGRPPRPHQSGGSHQIKDAPFPPSVQPSGTPPRDSAPQRPCLDAAPVSVATSSHMRTSLGQVLALARLPEVPPTDYPTGGLLSGEGAVVIGGSDSPLIRADAFGSEGMESEGMYPQPVWRSAGTGWSAADRSPPVRRVDTARGLLDGNAERGSGLSFSDSSGFSLSSDSTRSGRRRRPELGPGRRALLAGRKAGSQRRRVTTQHTLQSIPGPTASRTLPTAPSPDRTACAVPRSGETHSESSPAGIPALSLSMPVPAVPSPSQTSPSIARATLATPTSARASAVGYILRFLLVVIVVLGLQAVRMRATRPGAPGLSPVLHTLTFQAPPPDAQRDKVIPDSGCSPSSPSHNPLPHRGIGKHTDVHNGEREDGSGGGIEIVVQVRPQAADGHQQGQQPPQRGALTRTAGGVLAPLRAMLFRARAVLAGVVGVITRPLRSYVAAIWRKTD